MAICHYDDTNSSGGLDKQARMLSRALRGAGEDVVVLASTRRWRRAGWHDDEGVPVRLFWTYTTPQVSGRHLPAALIWAVQLMLWIAWHRRRIRLIHVHQIRIHAFVAAIANRFFGTPTLLKSAVGGGGADIRAIGTRKYFGAAGRRFIIRHTTCFVAITKTVEEDLAAHGVARLQIRCIPNGIPIPPVEVMTGEVAQQRSRRVVFVGRLAPDKNPLSLARAALATAEAARISVEFYGSGRLREPLQSLIRSRPDVAVAYHGYVERPASVLSSYGYLLLPSNAEGLSNAMIEAMAHGVVPVATRVSGCTDHITANENGLFLEGVDEFSLGQALIAIAAISPDRWREMSDSARAYAVARFDIQAVVTAYQRLYSELTSLAGDRETGLKVVIGTHGFLPNIGGVSTNVSILAKAFVAAGHDVTVVSLSAGPTEGFGHKVYRSPPPWTLFSLYRRADILILSNLALKLIYPLLIMRRSFALRHHSESAFRLSRSRFSLDVFRRAVLPSARHFMTSDYVGRKSGFARYCVTSPFANPEYITEEVLRPAGERRSVVFVGRLEPEKGVLYILDRWAAIRDSLGVDELRVIGTGSLNGEVARRAAAASDIVYLGGLTRPATAAEMGKAAYALVPSLWQEPFGAVALEALAAGALVVLSDRGGLPETTGDLGFFFNPDEPASFEGALSAARAELDKHLADPSSRRAYERAVQEHVARFKPEHVVNAIIGVFERRDERDRDAESPPLGRSATADTRGHT